MAKVKNPKPPRNIPAADSEARINKIHQLILEGMDNKEIMQKCMKDFAIGESGYRKIYQKAMRRLKESFQEDVEELRTGVIADMLKDINTARKNYEKYESLGDPRSSAIAQQWFKQMIDLKKEYVEYYPGVKPTEQNKEQAFPSITFVEDDGVDDTPLLEQDEDED